MLATLGICELCGNSIKTDEETCGDCHLKCYKESFNCYTCCLRILPDGNRFKDKDGHTHCASCYKEGVHKLCFNCNQRIDEVDRQIREGSAYHKSCYERTFFCGLCKKAAPDGMEGLILVSSGFVYHRNCSEVMTYLSALDKSSGLLSNIFPEPEKE